MCVLYHHHWPYTYTELWPVQQSRHRLRKYFIIHCLIIFTARKRSLRRLCFLQVSVCPQGGACVVARGGGCVVALGGHAWLLRGGMRGCSGGSLRGCSQGGMRGCSGGVWLLWGGMHGCSGGACMVARGACVVAPGGDVRGCSGGGMHGCLGGHAWLLEGHAWLLPGGHAWFLRGGMRGFFHEIRSMSGRYASYWNAFLFKGNSSYVFEFQCFIWSNCIKFHVDTHQLVLIFVLSINDIVAWFANFLICL